MGPPARPRLDAPSPGGSRATTPPPAANPDAGDTIYEAGGALQGFDAEARRPTPPGHHRNSTSDCIADHVTIPLFFRGRAYAVSPALITQSPALRELIKAFRPRYTFFGLGGESALREGAAACRRS